MSDNGKTYLSLAEHGRRLGISKQAVHKAIARNALVPNAAGKFAHEDLTAALKAERADQDASDKTRSTSAVLKQKLLLLKIEAAEHELKIAQGRYVAVSDIRNELAHLITNAKNVLLSLPSSLAPQVIGLSTPEAEALLRSKISEALNQLSEGKYD